MSISISEPPLSIQSTSFEWMRISSLPGKGEPGANAWPDEEEERKENERVTFSMRVYPLLEMLHAAQKKGKKVMWGVP